MFALDTSLGSRNSCLFDRQIVLIVPRRFATLMLVLSKIDHFAAIAYINKLKSSNQWAVHQQIIGATHTWVLRYMKSLEPLSEY